MATTLSTVSVLMPVYNTEGYVAEAVESILNQTFTDFEFIIINDGSTDDSLKILQHYAQRDSRICLISRENKGISFTRNQLVEISKGKYLAWMDSDDISMPNRLELMVSWLDSNPDHIAIGCQTIVIDTEGSTLCNWNYPIHHNEIDLKHISGIGSLAMFFASSMILRSAVVSIGKFDEKLTTAEDLDLLLRLAEIGKIANMDIALYKCRQHMGSVTHTQVNILKRDYVNVVSRGCIRRGLPIPNMQFSSKSVSTVLYHSKWAWWALGDGHVKTARKHAFKCFKHAPFSMNTWRLISCVLRGY
jgi:glycosyltransferase involved in cell wall biosynthesis